MSLGSITHSQGFKMILNFKTQASAAADSTIQAEPLGSLGSLKSGIKISATHATTPEKARQTTGAWRGAPP
jgi:hypothetical protein